MSSRQRHEHAEAEFQDPLSDYEPPRYDDELERLLCEEKVTAVHATPVKVVSPDAPIRQVMAEMEAEGVACVLVADQDGLVGIFTERDVLNKVADRYATIKDRPIREVMTADPVAVYETDNAATALSIVAARGLRHAPVLDVNDHIIGVVSPRRITAFLRGHFERIGQTKAP